MHGGGGRGEMPTSFTMGGGIVQAGEMSGVHVRGECVQGGSVRNPRPEGQLICC